MSEEEYVSVITDREELYDKCENMEQLYDKYYLPLLDIYFRKTYKLQQQNKKYKQIIDKAIDKVYCWSEILQFEFKTKMLDILKGDSNE